MTTRPVPVSAALSALLGLLLLALPARAEETRWALLVGIDDYVDRSISDLTGSVNDVVAIREALVTAARFPSNQVLLMTSDDPGNEPTKGNLRARRALLARARDRPAGGAVGHGVHPGAVRVQRGAACVRVAGSRPGVVLGAWYGGNSGVTYEGGEDSSDWSGKQYGHTRAGTHPVSKKAPNAFGLHDMLGNVLEWCEDDRHASYIGAPTNGKAWVDSPRSFFRVHRGGGWSSAAFDCKVVRRNWNDSRGRSSEIGFRPSRPLR